MSNLLLKKEKKKILHEFILRFFIVVFIFFLVSIGVAIATLIPAYSLTFSKEVSISDEVNIFEQVKKVKKQDSLADILDRENLKISFLKKEKNIYISDFISEVINTKPKGITIKGFFYETSGVNNYLVVKGKAKNRNILISFVENLEKKDIFSKVEFPVSDLTKGEGVVFSIKINLIQKNEK